MSWAGPSGDELLLPVAHVLAVAGISAVFFFLKLGASALVYCLAQWHTPYQKLMYSAGAVILSRQRHVGDTVPKRCMVVGT